jgi:hypothetical protein
MRAGNAGGKCGGGPWSWARGPGSGARDPGAGIRDPAWANGERRKGEEARQQRDTGPGEAKDW